VPSAQIVGCGALDAPQNKSPPCLKEGDHRIWWEDIIYKYVLTEKCLYRCDKEFENTTLKLLSLFRENFLTQILLSEKQLGELFSVVLPRVKDAIKIDENLKESYNNGYTNGYNKGYEEGLAKGKELGAKELEKEYIKSLFENYTLVQLIEKYNDVNNNNINDDYTILKEFPNEIHVHNDYIEILIPYKDRTVKVKTNRRYLDTIKKYRWTYTKTGARTNDYIENRSVALHRLITALVNDDKFDCSFKDEDKTNCLKENIHIYPRKY
jgi:hypothetical protein